MSMFVQGLQHLPIQTKHKPLIPILNNKPLKDMSPCIQAIRLKQMKYSFLTEYVKEKELEDANALSRSPAEKWTSRDINTEYDVLAHVCLIITNISASYERLKEIKWETAKDSN